MVVLRFGSLTTMSAETQNEAYRIGYRLYGDAMRVFSDRGSEMRHARIPERERDLEAFMIGTSEPSRSLWK